MTVDAISNGSVQAGSVPGVVKDILEWINQDLSREMAVGTIAARAGYSPWHFQRLFRDVTGVTIAAYVRRQRAEHAAGLLISSDETVYAVSCAVGFENYLSFLRAFKRQFNTSPTQYRGRHKAV